MLNQKVLRSLRATQNHKVIHQRKKQVEIDALNQEIKHAYAIYRVYTNDAYLTKQINTANSFRNMFTYGNISTTYYGAFHPINLL
ncbi:MAG: hypothetical protein LBD75_04475 [Candidatus Peribacteria bacterium]|nr:hypothetical protein [Candidatus Peribacteria bacterium]